MDRHSLILEVARTRGRVMVDELVEELGVSAHTIRRDINTLCEQAKLRRLHGGAEFIEREANLSYCDRRILNVDAKKSIATAVAALIPDGATIAFSIGTTPAVVASALSEHEGLTFLTNNLNVAMAASESRFQRVIVPAGEVRLPDQDILGTSAEDMFASYRADFGIFGVAGVDDDGTLLDFHVEEVRIRQAIRAHARQAILVLDVSKFGRRAPAVGGLLTDADKIVTDTRPDAPFAGLLDPLEDRVIIAGDTR